MVTLWFNAGVPVVDAGNAMIDCAACPCGGTCPPCGIGTETNLNATFSVVSGCACLDGYTTGVPFVDPPDGDIYWRAVVAPCGAGNNIRIDVACDAGVMAINIYCNDVFQGQINGTVSCAPAFSFTPTSNVTITGCCEGVVTVSLTT